MARRELKPEEWLDEIDRGLEYRRQYGLEDSWAENEATFYNLKDVGAGPNLFASQGDALLSALSVPYPYISISPRQPLYTKSAMVVESVDNWLQSELDIAPAMDRAILNAFLWGKGILKLGYDSEFGYDPRFRVDADEVDLAATLTQFDAKGRRIESTLTRPGMPWVNCVPTHDIVVPWGTMDLESAIWIAHRVVRHIEDIKADVKYGNKQNLQPTMSMADYVKSYTTTFKPYRVGRNAVESNSEAKAEFVELWEIHDQRSGKVIVVATHSMKFHRNEINLLQLDGPSFVSIGFVPGARTFWTTPDSYYLRQPQAELNDISAQATKERRLSVLKFLFQEGAMDEEEVNKMLSPWVGAAAKVKANIPLKEAFMKLEGHNNQTLWQDADHVHQNARELLGFSRNQLGEFAGGRKTATEVGVVAEASQSRMGRRQLALRRSYIRLYRKLNQIIFRFWTMPRVIQVVGPDGADQWARFTGDQLQGEYAYEVTFSSEVMPTKSSKIQEALQMYVMLANDPMIDQSVLRSLFADSYNDPRLRGLIRTTPNADLLSPVQGVQNSSRSVASTSSPAPKGNQRALPSRGL